MFEKEADLAETEMLINCNGDYSKKKNYREGWQEGATFGYNKANKEIKLLKETHRQSIGILVEQIEELHKANEWHYPSKGEYPKTKKKVLVQLKDVEEPILDYYRQEGLWNYALEDEVIAWKEIELPKEIKEND